MEIEHLSTEWKMGQDINKEIIDFLELDENEPQHTQTWEIMKRVLWGKFTALSVYIKTTDMQGKQFPLLEAKGNGLFLMLRTLYK